MSEAARHRARQRELAESICKMAERVHKEDREFTETELLEWERINREYDDTKELVELWEAE